MLGTCCLDFEEPASGSRTDHRKTLADTGGGGLSSRNGNIGLSDLQKSLDRFPETRFEEPAITFSALNILSPSEIAILDEYIFLRESGFDVDTTYSFLDGRHKAAISALDHLSQEYTKQEQALKQAERPKKVKPSRYRPARHEGVQAYLKDLGHVPAEQVRVCTSPDDFDDDSGD